MGSYLSIITLNINGLNTPNKRQTLAEWIQNKMPIYTVYKRPTSNKRTHTDWKWRSGKRYFMKESRGGGGGLVTQSCPTLCSPMDCSSSGSSVYGILQARKLEWVAISFSRLSSWPGNWTQVSCIAGRFSKLVKKYVKAIYCHPAYLTYMQSTSCEMPGKMKHNWNQVFREKCQ